MSALTQADTRLTQFRVDDVQQSRRGPSGPREIAEFAGRFAAMLEQLNGVDTASPTGMDDLSAGAASDVLIAPAPKGGALVGPSVASLIAQGGFDSVTGDSADSVTGDVPGLDGAVPASDVISAKPVEPPRVGPSATTLLVSGFDSVSGDSADSVSGGVPAMDAKADPRDTITAAKNTDTRWMAGLLAEG